MKRNLLLLSLLLMLFTAACQRPSVQNYSTDINALKQEFNQAKGKVRIVLLLSPT